MRKGWLGSKFLGTVFFYNELLIKKKKWIRKLKLEYQKYKLHYNKRKI